MRIIVLFLMTIAAFTATPVFACRYVLSKDSKAVELCRNSTGSCFYKLDEKEFKRFGNEVCVKDSNSNYVYCCPINGNICSQGEISAKDLVGVDMECDVRSRLSSATNSGSIGNR